MHFVWGLRVAVFGAHLFVVTGSIPAMAFTFLFFSLSCICHRSWIGPVLTTKSLKGVSSNIIRVCFHTIPNACVRGAHSLTCKLLPVLCFLYAKIASLASHGCMWLV
jgi:hypothetical protein